MKWCGKIVAIINSRGGGASRPPVLEFPCELQVKKMEKIYKEVSLLLKEPQPESRRKRRRRSLQTKETTKELADERDDEGACSDADAGSDHDQNQNQINMNMEQVERGRALNQIKWCNILIVSSRSVEITLF
eukprot:755904_1